MKDALSVLQVYQRILAAPDDGYRRAHRLTQPGRKHQAQTWLQTARRFTATRSLVEHDERWKRTA